MPKHRNQIACIYGEEGGFGFIESLIAVIVAGIACVALLSIAVGVIREAKKNEIRDAMNQYALEGLERVRKYAGEDYSNITSVCDQNLTAYAFLDINDELPDGTPNGMYIEPISGVAELCSQRGEEGTCERLQLPDQTGGRDIFYREITMHPRKPGSCSSVRIEVKVGLIDSESLEISAVSMVGSVTD